MKKLFRMLVGLFLGLLQISGLLFNLQGTIAHASNPQTTIGGPTLVDGASGAPARYPAVSQCNWQTYLVVYERQGDIYGRYLDQNGASLGDVFVIFNGVNNASDPAVACYSNMGSAYLVVFAYDYAGDGSDIDVRGQLVEAFYLAGSHLIGSWLWVSQTGSGVDETDPAVACNSVSDTCLVTFTYSGSGAGDILGQRVNLSSGSAVRDGDRFSIGDYTLETEGYSDVAWSSFHSRYLATWQSTSTTEGGANRIQFVHVYGVEQGSGVEERSGMMTELDYILPADPAYSAHQVYPSVACSPHTGHCMITYFLNGSGITSAISKLFSYDMTFVVKQILDSAAGGRSAAAFCGFDQWASDSAKPEFLAAFTSTSVPSMQGVYSANLPDMDDTNGYGWFKGTVDAVLSADSWIYNPDVAASPYTNHYLVVYEVEMYTSGDHYVFAQLVDHIQTNYLPLIRR